MINFYYGYSIIWSLILFFYSLGYSNLCKPIDKGLLLFLMISIFISAILGYIQKNKFKNIELKKNPHKNYKMTLLFLVYFIIEIIVSKKVPLLSVIRGQSYSSINYEGINGLHVLVSSAAIIYSFYLSFLYANFRDKRLLIENSIILAYFIMLVQRQNILICILGFILSMSCLIKKNRRKNKRE